MSKYEQAFMLRFHAPSIPKSTKSYNTPSGLTRIGDLNLDGLELPFTRGVKMSSELAGEVKRISNDLNLTLTVHAPFWINFNSKESEKVERSKQYLLNSLRKAQEVEAKSVTFHPAFMHGDSESQVLKNVAENLKDVLLIRDQEGIDPSIDIAPELTGKPYQFGSLDHLLNLREEMDNQISFCIDFAHLYARTNGEENGGESFQNTLDTIKDRFGKKALERLHIHFGGMIYGDKGEKKHRPLEEEDDFKWRELIEVLKNYEVVGWASIETPDVEVSTKLARDYYHSL